MTTLRVGASRGDASRLGSLSALALAVAASLPVMAQQPGAEEIIITGSRVSRSGFDSSQPLTTIDSEQIENLGLVNVGDVVRTLPQNEDPAIAPGRCAAVLLRSQRTARASGSR